MTDFIEETTEEELDVIEDEDFEEDFEGDFDEEFDEDDEIDEIDDGLDEEYEEEDEEAEEETEPMQSEKDEEIVALKKQLDEARETVKQKQFEALAAKDLAELKGSFPELVGAEKIDDCFGSLEDFKQFGKLRDAGVAPKTAYRAVLGEKLSPRVAAANGNKRHITSVAPKKASDEQAFVSKATLKEWREYFPDKTDKELRALYRQTL